MATFGKTDIGTSTTGVTYSECHFAQRFPLTAAGTVTSLSAYLLADTSSDIHFRLCLWSDSGTDPQTLLGITAQQTMTAGSGSAWRSGDLVTPAELTPDDYWISVHYANSNSSIWRESFIESGTLAAYSENLDIYSDGTASTWAGTTLYPTRTYCLYATYTPSSGFTGITVTRSIAG